jgi:hypothetical protein
MAIKTSQKLKAEVIEDFNNGNATISADAIADGETNVSMTVDERANLEEINNAVERPTHDDRLRLKDGVGRVFLDVTPETIRHVLIDLLAERSDAVAEALVPEGSADRLRLKDGQDRVFLDVTPETIRHVLIDFLSERSDAVAQALVPDASTDRLRLKDALDRIFLDVTPERLRHVEIDALKASTEANTAEIASTRTKVTRLRLFSASIPEQAAYTLRALLAHIILYGQSVSIGVNGRPAISTVAGLAWARMFEGGLRSRDANVSSAAYNANFYASLVGLKEADTATDDGYGETGAYGMAEMIAQLLLDENGIDIGAIGQQFLFSAPGEGSQPISALQSGGTYWPRVQADVANGQARGAALGQPYLVHGITWRQGERDTALGTNPATYKAALKDQVVGALRTYAAGVTGVDQPIPCIVYQFASHRHYAADPLIAMALVELAESEENFALSTPLYFMPHSDLAHLTPASYRRLGAYEGIAWKRWLFDGVKPRHLRPLAPTWLNGSVIVPFDVPEGSLVFDTATVTNPGNYGFSLVNNAGAAVAITGVSLIGTDRVLIKHSGGVLSAGSEVRYAWGTGLGDVTGPTSGPRGNLRDRQGDSITYKGLRMDNWCPIFRKVKG